MSLNVANCPRCGRIFAKTVRNLCPDCLAEEEELYQIVYRYLRDNPKSTVQQVSENTGVPEERILAFLRQDRIMTSEWTYLTYPCERCGKQINSGRYCEGCTVEMQQSLDAAARSIKPTEDKERRGGGYHIDKRRPR
ncbi:MAG TPA: hypothetical protein GX738_00045 [Firmicutes bacterium]|jgi:flagellar operon protein (TIGR03826 family)|nr:hypothetical protein [Bacillota bacterium]